MRADIREDVITNIVSVITRTKTIRGLFPHNIGMEDTNSRLLEMKNYNQAIDLTFISSNSVSIVLFVQLDLLASARITQTLLLNMIQKILKKKFHLDLIKIDLNVVDVIS